MAPTPAPTPELRAKMKRIGEVLENTMDRLGWDYERLARATGYSTNFVRGTGHATQWNPPSRPALIFMFDVMGADTSTPDIIEVLGYCPNRGQASGKVKQRMKAFYNRTPGDRDAEVGSSTRAATAAVESYTSTLDRRRTAIGSIMDDLGALEEVGWADVAEWVTKNGPNLTADQRAVITKAIWA